MMFLMIMGVLFYILQLVHVVFNKEKGIQMNPYLGWLYILIDIVGIVGYGIIGVMLVVFALIGELYLLVVGLIVLFYVIPILMLVIGVKAVLTKNEKEDVQVVKEGIDANA